MYKHRKDFKNFALKSKVVSMKIVMDPFTKLVTSSKFSESDNFLSVVAQILGFLQNDMCDLAIS